MIGGDVYGTVTVRRAPALRRGYGLHACTDGEYCAGGEAAALSCSDEDGFDDDADPATPCETWTVCVAGEQVTAEPSATSDRACAACEAEHFSTEENAATCSEWQACAAGSAPTQVASATQDRACGACEAGEYCAGGAAAAAPCVAGTSWDHDGDPATACMAATALCSAGFEQAQTPSPTQDRVCSACDAGEYCAGGTAGAASCAASSGYDHDANADRLRRVSTCVPASS